MIRFDYRKCIRCKNCCNECHIKILGFDQWPEMVHPDGCIRCGHCIAVCPVEGAVYMDDDSYTPLASFDAGDTTVHPSTLQNFMAFRRSTRKYTREDVTEEDIRKIIEAGRYAPTGGNRQSLRFIVLKDALPEVISMVAQELHDDIGFYRQYVGRLTLERIHNDSLQGQDGLFFGAPVVLGVADLKGRSIDGGIAVAHMELMANALGLGALINGIIVLAANRQKRIAERIGVPEGYELVITLGIGHPNVTFTQLPPRRTPSITWK